MIPAPTFGIGDVHLITQHIPDYARLLPRIQCLNHRHAMQFGQALVMGQRSAIAPPEHLFKQLPKFAFLHAPKCTQSGPHTKKAPGITGRPIYGDSLHAAGGQSLLRPYGVEIVGDHAQHLRATQAERLRNGGEQLRAGLLLPALDLGQVSERDAGFLTDLP